ncbi:glycosyltransferase [Lactobacillus delbrueckii]|uniref:Glycosyltransferase n=1 Tax=Lactobacillus delbrueckii subsp. lactis TaxID=29397 RepID=A0ABD4SF15_LACDL|nr:glycosyltransferase [Lactobacillus delbrueckii subsp. lactis]MCD5563119.1 glycosyltransferase [Lactobacillus delbrueckii subsp. lactis]
MVWVKLVSTSLITLIMIYMIYYSLVSIKAYRGNFKIAPHHKARTKFLVLIPAVNEEAVINIPVDDLKNQKYPKKLFDVYVIADHCTDKTAMIAKKHGAKVITTEMGLNVKRHGVGKSNTLDYGLHYLGLNEWNKYKYVVVIDSDNNVASNFLQRLNDYAVEFSEPEAIQVHLDSKQLNTL